jgi:hypothetical protein
MDMEVSSSSKLTGRIALPIALVRRGRPSGELAIIGYTVLDYYWLAFFSAGVCWYFHRVKPL